MNTEQLVMGKTITQWKRVFFYFASDILSYQRKYCIPNAIKIEHLNSKNLNTNAEIFLKMG